MEKRKRGSEGICHESALCHIFLIKFGQIVACDLVAHKAGESICIADCRVSRSIRTNSKGSPIIVRERDAAKPGGIVHEYYYNRRRVIRYTRFGNITVGCSVVEIHCNAYGLFPVRYF